MNELGFEAFIDLLAQEIDVHINYVRAGIEAQVPDVFEQVGAAHYPALVAQQVFE
jgi:hypothetical protein